LCKLPMQASQSQELANNTASAPPPQEVAVGHSSSLEERLKKLTEDRDRDAAMWAEQHALQEGINARQERINIDTAARIAVLDRKIKEIQDHTAEQMERELDALWSIALPLLKIRFNHDEISELHELLSNHAQQTLTFMLAA